MKFVLIRHGETEWNVEQKVQGKTDIPLNKNGIEQAREFDDKDLMSSIEKIYTSKLQRAKQTAEIIADKYKLSCDEMDGLEEIDFGIFEGHSWDELKQKYPDIYWEWRNNRGTSKVHKGESYEETAVRGIDAMLYIKEHFPVSEPNKKLLIVTHSGIMKAILCKLNNIPYEDMQKHFILKNLGTWEIEL